MLNRLTVYNLAIVERVEVPFAAGLNVLTGETGAGKSILMGALELVLGGRADASLIRDGAQEAKVEAVFEVGARECAYLQDLGFDCDGELIVRRTLSQSAPSRVWINDTAASLTTLKNLGRFLVVIHGPRANQQLLEERFQRETLDAYGNLSRADYAAAWQSLSTARAQLAELEQAGATDDELDLLRYQVQEFEAAQLSAEDEDLAARHAAAAHAEEIVAGANELTEALGGDRGVAESLIRLQPLLARLTKHFPDAATWSQEIEDLTVRAQELSRTIADSASQIDADPRAFEEMDARLAVVNRLRRKYAKGGDGSIAALLTLFEQKQAKLADWENRDEKLAALRTAVAQAEEQVRVAGAALTQQRLKAAERLGKVITRELQALGFLQAKFAVRLQASAPTATGCDEVVYLFEPNPGESARPLSAIASSGEIARVMLALKSVLALHDAVGTLVFDEIDANIGGEVGQAVGEKMKAVAANRQVIAITHLPQTAVWGEHHLVVKKQVSGGRTRTHIEVVSGAAREDEISRMLGGESFLKRVR